MSIKIPTYPKKKITDVFMAGLDTDSKITHHEDGRISSSQLITIDLSKELNSDAIKNITIDHNGVEYAAPFPNPVHLFLSQGIEHYQISEAIKSEHFPKNCSVADNAGIKYLNIDLEETSRFFNGYIQHRAACIIMVVSSIEAYLNHVITNNSIYRTIRKGKPIEFNKEEIQSPKISFKEKIEKVIPQLFPNVEINKHQVDFENIFDLYGCRKDIIHMKTNTDPNFQQYLRSIEKMLEFDIKAAINSTIKFMNLVHPNFVEPGKR